MNVEQETAIVVGKYLVRRAKDGAFGILVRNLPPFDIVQLLNVFREAQRNGIAFRLGIIGYDARLPTDDTVIGTTSIATVVEWRNTILEPKIVIVRENVPLLHSLNQFEQLKGEKLYKIVADEASQSVGFEILWGILKRPRVRSFIPLDGLFSYYTALLNTPESQRRLEAGRSLYLLGLLEDTDLFQDLAPVKMVERLEQNHENVNRIARMSSLDRQRLSRALRLPSDLADTYEQVMDYYRKPQETNLKGITLENVKRLWHLPEAIPPVDTVITLVDDIPNGNTLTLEGLSPMREFSPTSVRETIEALLDNDKEKREEVLYTHFDHLREHDEEILGNQNAGMLYQTQQLFELTVTEMNWGGIFHLPSPEMQENGEVNTLGSGPVPQRLQEIYAYKFTSFAPLTSERPEWRLAERLKRLVEEFELDEEVLKAFDRLQSSRRVLLLVKDQLVRFPLLTINSYLPIEELDEELRARAIELNLHTPDKLRINLLACGRIYLTAHSELFRIIRQNYGQIAQSAPFGIEQFCSILLVLDTIIFELPGQYQALLSPLHPLHLWKYIELSVQTLETGEALSESDQALLKEQADYLPNLVSTIYLSRYITNDNPHMLLETGIIDGSLPYFEEYNPGSPGKTGTNEVDKILDRYLSLSPHATLGLRLAIVDAPDPTAILGIIARLMKKGVCTAIHLRFFVTSRQDRVMQSPLIDMNKSDYVEQVLEGGYGTLSLEIDTQPQTYSTIDEVLSHQPVHIALFFDPSKLTAVQIPRSFSILSPLCLPMKFHYDSLTDEVQIVPSADEGLFGSYNEIRNRLNGQLSGLAYGAKASLDGDHRSALENLVKHKHAIWLVVIDRPREEHEQLDLPRIALLPSGSRDVQVFASSLSRFEREFRLLLQDDGYEPNETSIKELIDTLGGIVTDGLLSLITRSFGVDGRLINFETASLHNVLGILVAANWYYKQQKYENNGCLLVSLDSKAASTWLRLDEQKGSTSFVGLSINPTDSSHIFIDLLEVKTEENQHGYKTNGHIISGIDVQQLLKTADLLISIFHLNQQSGYSDSNILIPAKREVLRQLLFRECFARKHRTQRGYRRFWANFLNSLFDPDKNLGMSLTLRLWLIDVELVQPGGQSSISSFITDNDGRSINLVRITKDQIAQFVGSQEISTSEVKEANSIEQFPEAIVFEKEFEVSATKDESKLISAATTLDNSFVAQSAIGNSQSDTLKVKQQATELRRVLNEYGIKLLDLNPALTQIGPSILRYRVRLAPGTKLRDVQACAEDVARELSLHTTPIINNIPGEPFIAIDIERSDREIVPLEEVLRKLPSANPNELIIACGRMPSGNDVQLDLVKLPHLLVAGTTESGKTMFLCTLLISLLRRYTESTLQLLLIDPKVTNFVFFEGVSNLLNGHIYTDALEATEVLQEVLTTELERRTALLTKGKQSNINNYNLRYPENAIPRILVVVDEYADLTAVLNKAQRAAFENSITRLAQRARSVGIHLVLATQRPSVDVVTGNLKANMPCRISFLLPSSVDSRTILDQTGAEHLLGRGDMLLLNNQRLQRLQGYFVTDQDIERLIRVLK